MAKLPDNVTTHPIVAAIYAAYEKSEAPRAHLGASRIGESCSRRLWLEWRWCGQEAFPGRVRRMFDTGKREESRLIADLRAIGCEVMEGPTPDEQWRVSACDGHFGGSLDAAGRGFPDAPKTWAVIEFKTHNETSFRALEAKGVQQSKPIHYAQMTAYAGLAGMDRMVYVAVNKNTDEIYAERLHFDKAEFDRLMAKAQSIISAKEPPTRISDDATFYLCRFCPFHAQCHGEVRPAVTCRSCAHSTPIDKGAWRCERFAAEIPEAAQRDGCADHRYIPALLERVAELVEVDGNRLTWRNKLTDRTFTQPGYTSAELVACKDFRIVGDAFMDEVKAVFGDASKVSSPAVGAETWTWQTFHNGTRHIRCERGGQFQTYISQTTESVARMRELGDPTYAPDADFLDNAEVFYDEPKATDGSKATRSPTDGSARRGRKT